MNIDTKIQNTILLEILAMLQQQQAWSLTPVPKPTQEYVSMLQKSISQRKDIEDLLNKNFKSEICD